MSKLKCSIVEDLMPLYIEDLLNEETKKDIELHLDECEDCKEVYDEILIRALCLCSTKASLTTIFCPLSEASLMIA